MFIAQFFQWQTFNHFHFYISFTKRHKNILPTNLCSLRMQKNGLSFMQWFEIFDAMSPKYFNMQIILNCRIILPLVRPSARVRKNQILLRNLNALALRLNRSLKKLKTFNLKIPQIQLRNRQVKVLRSESKPMIQTAGRLLNAPSNRFY